MRQRVADLEDMIRNSVTSLVDHAAFQEWFKGESPSPKDLVQLNNSFLYRDAVKTTKSKYYLFVPIGDGGRLISEPRVGAGRKLNNDYRLESFRSKVFPVTTALEEELLRQLNEVGRLVLILGGTIRDDLVFEAPINTQRLRTMVLDPNSSTEVAIENDVVTIRSTEDPEKIWDYIRTREGIADDDQSESLKMAVRKALTDLDVKAHSRLIFPGTGADAGSSLIADVAEVLKEHRESYSQALSRCQGDPLVDRQAFHDILRISYNFASDAIGFIKLLISVCDLKPIVFWATIGEHHALAEAFRTLHWAAHQEKPSLGRYIETIRDARNNAFHHLFPFKKSVKVQLEDGLQDVSLRLFSDYRRREENELHYRDRELVEVLTEFTRSPEKRVPPVFWEKNLHVLDCTISLLTATDRFIKGLAEVLDRLPYQRAG